MKDKPYIIKGGVVVDDRGTVTFCNDFDMTPIKRFYMLENHEQGFVRAWHGHLIEAKYVMVVSGVAVVGVAPLWPNDIPGITVGPVYALGTPERFILHANGDVLYIPPGYANGAKNLTEGTRIMHFSTVDYATTLEDNYRFDADLYSWIWEVKKR